MRNRSVTIVLGTGLAVALAFASLPARAQSTKAKPIPPTNTVTAPNATPASDNWTIVQPERKDAKGFSVVKPGEMADNFGGQLARSATSYTGVYAGGPAGSGGGAGAQGGNSSANALNPMSRVSMPKF